MVSLGTSPKPRRCPSHRTQTRVTCILHYRPRQLEVRLRARYIWTTLMKPWWSKINGPVSGLGTIKALHGVLLVVHHIEWEIAVFWLPCNVSLTMKYPIRWYYRTDSEWVKTTKTDMALDIVMHITCKIPPASWSHVNKFKIHHCWRGTVIKKERLGTCVEGGHRANFGRRQCSQPKKVRRVGTNYDYIYHDVISGAPLIKRGELLAIMIDAMFNNADLQD